MFPNSNNFLLTIALNCIQGYRFLEPFSIYLKKYFQSNPQLGARDRRNIRHLCYSWWRLGHAGKSLPINERMLVAFFLSYFENDKLSQRLLQEESLLNLINQSIQKKWNYVTNLYEGQFDQNDLFPLKENLEPSIAATDFILDGFTRRKLWIRVNKDDLQSVKDYFHSKEIQFVSSHHNELALQLADDYDVVKAMPYQKGWLEIQDYSSQEVGRLYSIRDGMSCLDACAASGGKSLQLLDRYKNIDLTVTDIRESILANLKLRFERNNIKNYLSIIVDWNNLEKNPALFKEQQFDVIIADVPCSGSGTWARTPEQKLSFNMEQLNKFSELQYHMVINLIPFLKKGGSLYYSTCSVYQKENTEVINKLISTSSLELIQSKMIIGINENADSMFVAELKRI